MSIVPCPCGLLRSVLGRTSVASFNRAFSTAKRIQQTQNGSGVIDEDSPATAARRASEASRARRSGPFSFAQPELKDEPKIPWHELGGGEKIGRTVANSSNLLVVVFGLSVTGLVVYAVSSELFASNSPTKLFEEASELIKHNAEVNSILLQPIKFHAESAGHRRNRRIRSSISVDRATGREKMTIRFYCDGKDPDTHESESYVQRVKRWIRPVIMEPSDPTDLLPGIPPQAAVEPLRDEPSSSSTSWLGSIFGSVLPSAYSAKNTTRTELRPDVLRTKPAKGTFARGEAVATLLLNDKGKFDLESLIVFYPDSRSWQWKTDVKGLQQTEPAAELQQGPNRYRFWSRKPAA